MQLLRGGESKGEKPVARETIKLKQIMERKRIFSKEHGLGDDADASNRLICSRIIVINFLVYWTPGIGQWKLITDKRDCCWICDQQIYGLLFWDKDYIAQKY